MPISSVYGGSPRRSVKDKALPDMCLLQGGNERAVDAEMWEWFRLLPSCGLSLQNDIGAR
eukprot:1157812-Pelagomonas_calceolata.AAC.2